MDNFNTLYRNLFNLQSELEIRIKEIDSKIVSLEKSEQLSKAEIQRLEEEKENKNNIYNILVNFEEIMIDEIKDSIKLISPSIIGYIFVWIVTTILISGKYSGFLFPGMALGIPTVLGLGALACLKEFLNATEYERNIYKKYKHSIRSFPLMIHTLDKRMHIEYSSCNYYKENILKLREERTNLEEDIDKIKGAIEYLAKRIPEVNYACRHHENIINEVYENDKEVQSIARLVRIKDNIKKN